MGFASYDSILITLNNFERTINDVWGRTEYEILAVEDASSLEYKVFVLRDKDLIKEISYFPLDENVIQVLEIANEAIAKDKEENEALQTLGE